MRFSWVTVICFVPALLLLFFWLQPETDLTARLPLFHFYIVTFTTFTAVVVSILLSTTLERVARPRHTLAAVAFAVMGLIFFSHGLPTSGALIHHSHPAVQWSAWLTLLAGSVIFLAASFDGAQETASWLSVRSVVYPIMAMVSLYLAVVVFVPHWLSQINVVVAPWHRIIVFGVTFFLWLGATLRLWRIWRVTNDSVDGILTVVAFWLTLATVSMHQFPVWRLSWWLYHFLLLLSFLVTIYILASRYEQTRRFRLMTYYVSISLIITSLLALVASYLVAEFSVRLLTNLGLDPEPVILPFRTMGLVVVASTMGLLFASLLLVVRRADRIISLHNKELAEANKELRRLETIRQDLSNMLIHDLRTPLTTIVASLDLANRSLTGANTAHHPQLMEKARIAATRLTNMVDDILSVSKLEAGEINLQKEEIGLYALLNNHLGGFMVQATVEKKNLTFDCPSNLKTCLDPALIGRVIENLVSNAFKYVDEDGLIKVAAWGQNDRVWISVLDNGDGIPDMYKERIFGKYTRAPENEERPSRRGTGLGLAFCRLVVEAHGGQIWVADAAQGGSEFKFWLPVEPVGQSAMT